MISEIGKRMVLGAAGLGLVGFVAVLVARSSGGGSAGASAAAASAEIRVVGAPRGARAHLALPGRPVLFKAVLAPSTRPRRAMWTFGDGQASPLREVLDPRVVSTTHVYASARPGQSFAARLVVLEDGRAAHAEYPVEVVESTLEHQRTVAIDDGLWALHASQRVVEHAQHGPLGVWDRFSAGKNVGITGLATLAFMVNGFDLRASRAGHAYEDTVRRGLAYCLSSAQAFEVPVLAPAQGTPGAGASAPPTTAAGDGRVLLAGSKYGYETPIVALALIASSDPGRRAGTANDAVAGRTFRDIGIDMLEGIAAGQIQRGDVGGWRYDIRPGSRKADLSVTQWPALALLGGEREWGHPIDPAVRQRLDAYAREHQGKDGGFGYERPGEDENVGLAAAGLISLTCAGVPASDPRQVAAREWIAGRWSEPTNVGDGYTMYAVMKAAKLSAPEVSSFGAHDWQAEYVARLAATQEPGGAWPEDERYGQNTLATVWPCLVLADDVFVSAEPVRESNLGTILAGAAAGVLGLVLVALSLRGVSG